MKAFEDYGHAVCTYIRHATSKEKAAIRKELADHMEDHAQALMNAGYDEEHSVRVALESMGEAEAVGRELDKEYPFRWLALATVLNILLALLICYLLIFSINWNPHYFLNTMEARTAPMSGHVYIPTHAGEIYPLDIRQELPGGTVLYLYGVARNEAGNVWVYTVSYPKNPFQKVMNTSANLSFSYGGTDTSGLDWLNEESNYSPRASYHRYCIQDVQPGDILTAHYDHYGTVFDVTIPWEEASP